jgi:two-component system cell cycle response regulator DivK
MNVAGAANLETRSSRTVLIVEDDERSRKLLRDLLQLHGYRTLEAGTAHQGFDLARAELPCLVLMDIRLPDGDGITVLEQMRSLPATAGIPVLAVTASVMRGDEQRFLRAGFNGYIPKPIDVETFPDAVKEYC